MLRRFGWMAWLFVLALGFTSVALQAQLSSLGTITGTVTDATGATAPNPVMTHPSPAGAFPKRNFESAGNGEVAEPRGTAVVEVVEGRSAVLRPPFVDVGVSALAADVVLPWWLRPIPVPRPASAMTRPSDAAVRARRACQRRCLRTMPCSTSAGGLSELAPSRRWERSGPSMTSFQIRGFQIPGL